MSLLPALYGTSKIFVAREEHDDSIGDCTTQPDNRSPQFLHLQRGHRLLRGQKENVCSNLPLHPTSAFRK